MRQPNEHWNEFDWEQSLREGDRIAERYFKLLRRFSDLPGANELIARHMGPDFDEDLLDFDLDEAAGALDDQPPPWETGTPDGPDFAGDSENRNGEDAFDDSDSLAYESHPLYMQLRQVALGWCNVYATMLPPDRRRTGLKILYHLGRALANLTYAMDEEFDGRSPAAVAFGKRSLKNVDQALGFLHQVAAECPRIRHILDVIREQLLKCADDLGEYIEQCRRSRKKGDGEP